MKFRKSAWVFAIAMSVSSASAEQPPGFFKDNRPDAAPLLLSAFRGTCGSQGVFTQNANIQAQAIVNVIETLKNTDACKPYVSSLATIQTAAASLQTMQRSPDYVSYQADQQNYQLLTLALQAAPTGTSEASSLQSALDHLRLQMFQDQASYDVGRETSQRNLRVSQTSTMLAWGQQLATTSSSPGLMSCLQQSPVAAIQLGTNLAAYGGSFLPGAYGPAVAVVGQLISTGLQALHDKQYDDAIFAGQLNQMPDALECALESLTESYCNADDSYKLLDLARRNRLADYSSKPLWKGIDILSRQIPSLVQWLGGIQNEVPPQDNFQSSKQSSVFQEQFHFQEINLDAIASINNAIDQTNKAASNDAKVSSMVNAVANIALTVSQVPPFQQHETSAFKWACWIIDGDDTLCPTPPDKDLIGSATLPAITDYIKSKDSSTGLNFNTADQAEKLENSILSNWSAIAAKVKVIVDTDFARIIATNAGIILSSARVPNNGQPFSPYQVLKNISDFLTEMENYQSRYRVDNPLLQLTLSQEKDKVIEAMKQLTAPDADVCPPKPRPAVVHGSTLPAATTPDLIPQTPEQCQVSRILRIFDLFGLQNGTQVFLSDIKGLVNIDLETRFANDEVASDPKKILQASGQDLALQLQSAGIGDLEPLASDLNDARADIEENIQLFRNFFVKAFTQAVAREATFAMMENVRDGVDRPHGQRLAELCMFWLITSNIQLSDVGTFENWPDAATQVACESTVYFNENAPSSDEAEKPAFEIGKLAATLGNKPFQRRVCTFHSYRIDNKAATRYGIAPSH